MGAWSVEPFGNDVAADWAWELEDESDWGVIEDALNDALEDVDDVDQETAIIAIAAAEVIAHGRGRATQRDAYTEEVEAFVSRAGQPDPDLVLLALAAVTAATGPGSELAAQWASAGDTGWSEAIDDLRNALTA